MMPSFTEKANALLPRFQSQDFQDSFLSYIGEGQVIVSAPHSVEQTRENVIKYGEPHTGVLAILLHERLNCHTIIKTRNCGDDANFDDFIDCKYKQFIDAYVKKHGIKFLIDLHMMSPAKEELIDIGRGGFDKKANILGRLDLADFIKKSFENKGFSSVVYDYPFDATPPGTVSATISRECIIPCFQIEFNTRLLRYDYDECRYEDVFETLCDIIKKLNEENV
jgi:hypothetical protein